MSKTFLVTVDDDDITAINLQTLIGIGQADAIDSMATADENGEDAEVAFLHKLGAATIIVNDV